MAHDNQRAFCEKVKEIVINNQTSLADYFKRKKVLDVGSLDINGNNRYLFENCSYVGVDLYNGKNVDIVTPVHNLATEESKEKYDTIISTEAFEHDKYLELTLKAIVHMLKPNGLFLFTCATEGRREHGTKNRSLKNSPGTPDYYKNVTEVDIRTILDIDNMFSSYEFEVNNDTHDLYFWGVKR